MDRPALDKTAKLARLEFSEAEANELTGQLQSALKHFEQIAKVDTTGVEPLVTPTPFEAVWRKDEVRVELSPEEITANAPSKQGHLFSVPPVV